MQYTTPEVVANSVHEISSERLYYLARINSNIPGRAEPLMLGASNAHSCPFATLGSRRGLCGGHAWQQQRQDSEKQ